LNYPFFKEHIQVLVNDMDKGSERIRNIIRDLKTFARRDEGRMDEAVDLNEVVRVCTPLVHSKIKHYQVEESLDPDLPQLRGSENKLEQVVIATLINAAEAIGESPNGAIQIISRAEDGGKSVSLSISDNGPGMSEELKDKIFDPFFTTKQRTGGTGLGLSITYGIIQEHGGHIKVDSQVGKGTTFTYHLPVERLKGVPNEPDPGD
jgi:signal transduction histidine kinase